MDRSGFHPGVSGGSVGIGGFGRVGISSTEVVVWKLVHVGVENVLDRLLPYGRCVRAQGRTLKYPIRVDHERTCTCRETHGRFQVGTLLRENVRDSRRKWGQVVGKLVSPSAHAPAGAAPVVSNLLLSEPLNLQDG